MPKAAPPNAPWADAAHDQRDIRSTNFRAVLQRKDLGRRRPEGFRALRLRQMSRSLQPLFIALLSLFFSPYLSPFFCSFFAIRHIVSAVTNCARSEKPRKVVLRGAKTGYNQNGDLRLCCFAT